MREDGRRQTCRAGEVSQCSHDIIVHASQRRLCSKSLSMA